jgi:hypothetical protein
MTRLFFSVIVNYKYMNRWVNKATVAMGISQLVYCWWYTDMYYVYTYYVIYILIHNQYVCPVPWSSCMRLVWSQSTGGLLHRAFLLWSLWRRYSNHHRLMAQLTVILWANLMIYICVCIYNVCLWLEGRYPIVRNFLILIQYHAVCGGSLYWEMFFADCFFMFFPNALLLILILFIFYFYFIHFFILSMLIISLI